MRVQNIQIENEKLLTYYISIERDQTIKYRLVFLQLVNEYPHNLEDNCRIFSVSVPTAYVWIREWNKNGYEGLSHPYRKSKKPLGRPPKLNDDDLEKLKDLLSRRPNWLTKEIAELIFKHWGIRLSFSQITRILRKKLEMHFSKPYPHDYRRAIDAEERLMEALDDKLKALKEKGIPRDEVAIGFLDETSPQTTANTVRFWHFGHGNITKNTSRYKSNAIGFYAIHGQGVIDFLANSKKESVSDFLLKIKEANANYKSIIVILDNFSSHVSAFFERTAEKLGMILVFLSPYSPDLNPIERIWKLIKCDISINFVCSLEHLRKIIADAWSDYSQALSYAKAWIEQFAPWILIEN